jgi:hypothetical protein
VLLSVNYIDVLYYKYHISYTGSGQTECEYRRDTASANAVPGAPILQCTPNGGYDKVQCRGSSCYCVDNRGNEIQGTTLAIADGKPKCDNPGIHAIYIRVEF